MAKVREIQLLTIVTVFAIVGSSLGAQGRGGAPQPPATAKAAAPVDLTGYWVSIVTGDWRFRMITPPRGDYTAVPLNAAARIVADTWDPARDEAAGEQCKSYGAPNIMRVPGRIHITWQDDQNLKLEMDAGTQTRMFSFGAPQKKGGEWQGVSKASWEFLPGSVTAAGSLKVVTTNLKPGYLRKNGVPYSANAILTEYFDRVVEPNGESYLVVTSTIEDPTYLNTPFMLSTHFRKQADAAAWNPTPCSAK